MKIFSWIFGAVALAAIIYLLGPSLFSGFGGGGDLDWRKPMSDRDPVLEHAQIAAPLRTLKARCDLPQLLKTVPIHAITLREGGIETPMQEFGTRTAQVDVLVTETKTPVALILAGRNAIIWNLRLVQGARVAAIVTTGFDRQVVVSREANIGVLPATLGDEECNTPLRRAQNLQALQQVSGDELKKLAEKAFGRAPDRIVDSGEKSEIIVGPEDGVAQLAASTEPFVVPDTMVDTHRPILFGRPALQRLVKEGVLSPATQADIDQWRSNGTLSPKPPSFVQELDLARTYVVRQHFQMPPGVNGLAASAFIIPPGGREPKARSITENVYLLSRPFGCKHVWGWFENCGKTLSTKFESAGTPLKSPGSSN